MAFRESLQLLTKIRRSIVRSWYWLDPYTGTRHYFCPMTLFFRGKKNLKKKKRFFLPRLYFIFEFRVTLFWKLSFWDISKIVFLGNYLSGKLSFLRNYLIRNYLSVQLSFWDIFYGKLSGKLSFMDNFHGKISMTAV